MCPGTTQLKRDHLKFQFFKFQLADVCIHTQTDGYLQKMKLAVEFLVKCPADHSHQMTSGES